MLVNSKIWRSNFLIKLRSWEYWPFGVVYAPVFAYWLWLSLKARSLFFFSASNPTIENGGMLGESKIKILDLIPDNLKARTLYLEKNISAEVIHEKMQASGLNYPVIAKPDIGERGWMVKKINDKKELEYYLKEVPVNFLIQEYLSHPIEMGIFYYRYPTQSQGEVTSIVIKEMLYVIGDGNATLEQLILKNDRSKLQWAILKEKYKDELDHGLAKEHKKELISIGNHCLGTKFLNGNHLINEGLHSTFDRISNEIKGFYFGRFDIRIASIEDLYAGNIKIMELNGAGAEPAHIYDPNFSFFKGVAVLLKHWKILYNVSRQNHKNGIPYMTWSKGKLEYAKVKALNKLK